MAIIDAVNAVNRAFAPDPSMAAETRLRLELIRSSAMLRNAWIAMLNDIEAAIRSWIAERTAIDVDCAEARAAISALLAVHRMRVETWEGEDVASDLDRAEHAFAVLDRGLRTLGR